MADRNEVHLTETLNGHVLSTDCWCEPKKIYWHTNSHGILMFVVEHDDDTLMPHIAVLVDREFERDWVTVLLDSLFR
jgi:hypothetical protein